MPYIKQEERSRYSPNAFGVPAAYTVGQLNYQITKLLNLFLEKHGKSYQIINDALGALEGAKLEFYRRVAAPYEDTKIKENGDVY